MIKKTTNKYWIPTNQLLALMGFTSNADTGNLIMKIDVMATGSPVLGNQISGIDIYVEQWEKTVPVTSEAITLETPKG